MIVGLVVTACRTTTIAPPPPPDEADVARFVTLQGASITLPDPTSVLVVEMVRSLDW